jgi:predicted phage gp36 major capsid-like protein
MEGSKGPAERSRRCLDLLVKHSRSAGGHLFLLADRQPQIAAERGERDLPGHIELQTRELLASLMRAEDDDDSHTMSETASDEGDSSQAADWTGDSGEQYRTCMLVHEEKTGRAIVGAAVLRVDPDSSFVMPHDLAVELSRFLFASGDVSAFIAGA